MKRSLLPVALASLIALAAFADAPDPVRRCLETATTSTEMRSRLADLAVSAPDSAQAGAAWYWRGVSFDRDGLADSAIACYTRAFERRGGTEERDVLAEALLRRNASGDPARVRAILEPGLKRAHADTPWELPGLESRLAWAMHLEGKSDSAARVLTRNERYLSDPRTNLGMTNEWRYRTGAAWLGVNQPNRTIDLLTPLAISSRFQDTDVMDMLDDAAARVGGSTHLQPMLEVELGKAEKEDHLALEQLGIQRLHFRAPDGFPLSGFVTAKRLTGARRAAVLIMDPGEQITDYDSLTAGLERSGYATIVVERRGSGHSVGASCPQPEAWRGREHALIERCAGDVRTGLRALARVARIDTTAYLLGASGSSAPIAIEAAAGDRAVRTLLLLSAAPSPVDIGPLVARLAPLHEPVFFQIGPEDLGNIAATEALYRAGNRSVCRISDTDRIGNGAQIVRNDPRILPRFRQWLRETWPSTTRKKTQGPRSRAG